ncbi:hypothetical protein HNP84_001848 [Thermocatellispora tengchongensis]|uniref:Uncharacterized protein n=1 Tax=Thermocatellispora tengchongensis TaxID=1073253 RepID=A0A840P7Z8_9ACTN|nr:hypothetical protein [Thermocatellispora tengchongensis]MBB5132135.1 hypothetical protein [Thermocatellispora tengchongensis]
MSVITLVVAVAILGAGVVAALVRRRRRRRDGEPRAPLGQASIEANIPTFRIVALGLQGSGKTLLLASMFQELKAPTRQSYYLSAPPADVARLTEWYSTMADTSSSGSDRDWPYGTAVGDTRRFLFSVRTRSGGVVHEVLRLDYLEYAGELLTGTDEDGARGREELFAHMESAHALLGILDGQRIRRHLDGHPGGWAELDRTLNILIPHMMNATCPIHFVITKWDLLDDLDEDENARLAIVRNMLMSNDHFRALVGTHSRDRVVRLIPVSAVGPGFARMDGQGHVVKVPHAQARPVYVDVPLSAVVPDLFDQAEMRLQAEFKAALDEETRRRTRQSPLESIAAATALAGQTAGRALLAALGQPAVAIMGDVFMGMYLDARRSATGSRAEAVGRELGEAEERVRRFMEARKRVLRDMRSKPDMLEGRLPNSRLSQGWPA